MEARDRLCIAFDVKNMFEAKRLAEKVAGTAGYAKVGMELFTAEGPSVIRVLQDYELKIFLINKIGLINFLK